MLASSRFNPDNVKIAVIGLGYVGLPLAVAFGAKSETLGFDIDKARVSDLKQGIDRTLEVEDAELAAATELTFTSDVEDMAACNVFIVTVPTPVTAHKQPDLFPLRSASEMISSVLKRGDIVIYESTVFPGATEEICVPILEQHSGWFLMRIFSPATVRSELTLVIRATGFSILKKSPRALRRKSHKLLTIFTPASLSPVPIWRVVSRWQRLQR